MVYVDENVFEGLLFQIISAGISKEAIDSGCLRHQESSKFLSELREVIVPKALQMSKMYHSKYKDSSVNKDIVVGYLKNHLAGSFMSESLYGYDLIDLGDTFMDVYGCVYEYFGFDDDSNEFEIEKWNDEVYVEEAESGQELWYYLCDNGFYLYGETEEDTYVDKCFLYELEIVNGFLLDMLKYVEDNSAMKQLALYYLDKIVYITHGVQLLAVSSVKNEKAKLLLMKGDYFIDTKKELFIKMLYMAMIPVIKKYMEMNMETRKKLGMN